METRGCRGTTGDAGACPQPFLRQTSISEAQPERGGDHRPRSRRASFVSVDDLASTLMAEPDEEAVLSVIAAPDGAGAWRLMHGSLILAPQRCAQISWQQWSESHATQVPLRQAPQLPVSFAVTGGHWMIAREVMDPRRARRWLEEVAEIVEYTPGLVTNGVLPQLPAVGHIPPLIATLAPPQAVIHVLPGTDSAAGTLAAALSRPLKGLLWLEEDPAAAVRLPDVVELDGEMVVWPAHHLAGMHLTPESVDQRLQTPQGLLVGRAERRAWLGELRGSEDMDQLTVTLGWEPDRIDIVELELQLEEYLDDGELVHSARVVLEDIDTEEVHDTGFCRVQLPTLGAKLRHAVSLGTREGELLDRRGPYPLVEQVTTEVTIDAQPLPPIVVGELRPSPVLADRLQTAAEIIQRLDRLQRTAAEGRILRQADAGRSRLLTQLRCARVELMVFDPYFGQFESDWELLAEVKVPTRVITTKIAGNDAPLPPHVEARLAPKKSLHDRLYLWRGGGMAIGGSLSTLGHAPVYLARLRPADAAAWAEHFEQRWQELTREVPRRR
jgi:hypothetical protein